MFKIKNSFEVLHVQQTNKINKKHHKYRQQCITYKALPVLLLLHVLFIEQWKTSVLMKITVQTFNVDMQHFFL